MALLARTGGRAIRTTLRATTIAAGNVAQPAARQGLRQSFSRSCSSTVASAEREAAVAKVKDVLQNDPALTEAVVESMCVKSRRELVRLAIKADGNMAAAEFRLADKNQDGLLDLKEFQGWLVASAQKGGREGLGQVTRQQMIQYGVLISVPMIGFGFVDNVIMITAGDWIDNHLGLAFGLSTLAAAGFGNLISDVAGLGLGGYIEASADKLGIKNPNLTQLQEATSRVRTVRNVATVGGITLGCLLGMVPLFFIDEEKRMLRQVFDELDTAGNGVISVAELQTGLLNVGLGLSTEAVEEFIRQSDLDHDNSLDFSEFCKMAERFKELRKNAAIHGHEGKHAKPVAA